MREKDVKKALLFTAITIVVILYRDLFNNELPFLVFSILTVISAFFLDTSGRFLYITALLPFCRGIPYSEMMLIVLIVEGVFVLFVQRKIRAFHVYLPILLLCIIELLDYLYFNLQSIEMIYVAVYMVFTTYAVVNQVYRGKEPTFVWFYGVSSAIAVISVIIREINQFGLDQIIQRGIRFGANVEDLTVTSFNANELGLYCAMAVALFLWLHLYCKKVWLLVFATLLSFLGMVSISRTYLIVVVMTWLFYLFAEGIKPRKILLSLTIFVLMMSLIAFLFPGFANWIGEYFVSRFETTDGRIDVLLYYYEKWSSGWWPILFGFSGIYPVILTSSAPRGVAVHNGIQEILICWGLLGLIVFGVWVILLLKNARKNWTLPQRRKKVDYLTLITFLVFIQTLQLITMHNYLTVMMLALIPLSFGLEGNYEKEIIQSPFERLA